MSLQEKTEMVSMVPPPLPSSLFKILQAIPEKKRNVTGFLMFSWVLTHEELGLMAQVADTEKDFFKELNKLVNTSLKGGRVEEEEWDHLQRDAIEFADTFQRCGDNKHLRAYLAGHAVARFDLINALYQGALAAGHKALEIKNTRAKGMVQFYTAAEIKLIEITTQKKFRD